MIYTKQYLTKSSTQGTTSIFRYISEKAGDASEIYAMISIAADNEDSHRMTKFLWDGFLDGFFTTEGDIIAQLKNGLQSAQEKLKELMRHSKELEKAGVNLDMTVIYLVGNRAYFAVLGDHDINVCKNKEKWINVSALLKENKSATGSSMLRDDDLVVISADKLEHISFADLNMLFESSPSFAILALSPMDLWEEKKEEPVISEVKEEVQEPIQEEEIVEEVLKEEVRPESIPIPVEPKKNILPKVNIPKLPVVDIKSKVKNLKIKEIIQKVVEVLKPIAGKFLDFLSKVFASIGSKLRGFINNRYGKKVWFKKMQSKISQSKLNNRPFKPMRIDSYKDKDLRNRRFVIFFLFVLIGIGLFFGVKTAMDARDKANIYNQFNTVSKEVEGWLSDAERKAGSNSEESAALLTKSENALNDFYKNTVEVPGKIDKFDQKAKFDELKSSIQRISDRINRVVALSEEKGNIELYLDTKINFGDNTAPNDIAIYKDKNGSEFLYIVDTGEKSVFEVAVGTGGKLSQRKILDESSLLKSPLFVDYGNDGLYVYDSSAGVFLAPSSDDKRFDKFEKLTGIDAEDVGGTNVSGFAVFGALDYLNFIQPKESTIFRSIKYSGGSYALPSVYVSNPEFNTATDLFGDLYIYVLTDGPSGFRRFVGGTSGLEESPLTITGLNKDIEHVTYGYTGGSMDNKLFLFDEPTKRLLSFEKPKESGEVVLHPGEVLLYQQYVYRGNRQDVFSNVKDIVVSSDESTMFVLDGNKVWKIKL